jgi:hypothetical protein
MTFTFQVKEVCYQRSTLQAVQIKLQTNEQVVVLDRLRKMEVQCCTHPLKIISYGNPVVSPFWARLCIKAGKLSGFACAHQFRCRPKAAIPEAPAERVMGHVRHPQLAQALPVAPRFAEVCNHKPPASFEHTHCFVDSLLAFSQVQLSEPGYTCEQYIYRVALITACSQVPRS